MMGNMGESTLGLAAHFHVNAALANATHCDADLPTRPGGLLRDIATGLVGEVRDGVSRVVVPTAPGLGVEVDEEAVAAQRVDASLVSQPLNGRRAIVDAKKVRKAFEAGAAKAAAAKGRPERQMAPILRDDIPTFMEAPLGRRPPPSSRAPVPRCSASPTRASSSSTR